MPDTEQEWPEPAPEPDDEPVHEGAEKLENDDDGRGRE